MDLWIYFKLYHNMQRINKYDRKVDTCVNIMHPGQVLSACTAAPPIGLLPLGQASATPLHSGVLGEPTHSHEKCQAAKYHNPGLTTRTLPHGFLW
jgi:hypothetical protein